MTKVCVDGCVSHLILFVSNPDDEIIIMEKYKDITHTLASWSSVDFN